MLNCLVLGNFMLIVGCVCNIFFDLEVTIYSIVAEFRYDGLASSVYKFLAATFF